MTMKRLIPLLTLLALLFAPVGRVGAAEAAMPTHDQAAAATHCNDMPAPSQDERPGAKIDCMISCAVVAPPSANALPLAEPMPVMVEAIRPTFFAGINPGSDPPPPRAS
jgi:hypothetical protein